MKLSDNGRKLLAEWEGVKLQVYNDQAGYPTIGVGHKLNAEELGSGMILINGDTVAYKNGLTYQQALDLLAQDVVSREGAVNHYVKVPLNQNQFDALVSFAFNVGIHNFSSSTLLTKLNAGQYDQVPVQLMKWVYVHHNGAPEVSQELVHRRTKEVTLWNTPIEQE
jgi:lysozyme